MHSKLVPRSYEKLIQSNQTIQLNLLSSNERQKKKGRSETKGKSNHHEFNYKKQQIIFSCVASQNLCSSGTTNPQFWSEQISAIWHLAKRLYEYKKVLLHAECI